jgi:predicted phage terminase large subunit-like protein
MAKQPKAAIGGQKDTNKFVPVTLTATIIEGFQKSFLWDSLDGAAETAEFHRIMWEDACDLTKTHCAWAAPRGHSKSTSITFTYALAVIMFRVRDHLMIVSDSESQAVSQLKEIKNEIYENESLTSTFGFRQFLKDAETEIILEFTDGYQVRVLARGSEQRLRGLKWRNKRPNLVLGDDLEFDEVISNPDRLQKFKAWFRKALLPVGSRECVFRIVGTILSFDSMLAELIEKGIEGGWHTRQWSAHESYSDFSNILWPARWTEEGLRGEQLRLGPDAYSQEYLNRPIPEGHSFFDKSDLLRIPDETIYARDNGLSGGECAYYVSVDLAVSQKKHADRSAVTVGAMTPDGYLDVVEVIAGRFDPKTLFDILFQVDERYSPELFLVEAGVIQKSIGPFLNEEMGRRQQFLRLHLMTPAVDKITRARSIQARMRAGRVRFDKSASWYPDLETEMLQFPRGKHDDIVDTMSQFGLALDDIIVPPSQEELDEEEWAREEMEHVAHGRNPVTGY